MTQIELWRLTITADAALADVLQEPFANRVLALTVMNPPRVGQCRIEAIFDQEPDRGFYVSCLHVLAITHGAPEPEYSVEKIEPEDWLRRVAVDTPPRHLDRLTVYGAHDRDTISPHKAGLMIEAATAFGTGEHPSTQMCLLLLQRHLRRRGARHVRHALDLGCGSGILALSLARLTPCHVLAVDNDAESVRMTMVNARANGLNMRVAAALSDGYGARRVRQGAPYDLIFANIFAKPLMLLANDLRRHLKPGGVAILAGLLRTQLPMVLAAHRMQRLSMRDCMTSGEWAALTVEKKRRD